MGRLLITEEEKERIKMLYEQPVTLAAIDNKALINQVKFKLQAWAGGLMGYQPVQIKGLRMKPDGTAELTWKFDAGIYKDSGTDIIPKAQVDQILRELKTKNEIKFTLKNGKTVKLVKV